MKSGIIGLPHVLRHFKKIYCYLHVFLCKVPFCFRFEQNIVIQYIIIHIHYLDMQPVNISILYIFCYSLTGLFYNYVLSSYRWWRRAGLSAFVSSSRTRTAPDSCPSSASMLPADPRRSGQSPGSSVSSDPNLPSPPPLFYRLFVSGSSRLNVVEWIRNNLDIVDNWV